MGTEVDFRRRPPVFVFNSVYRSYCRPVWEDPRTWEPFAGSCDLLIAEHRAEEASAGWRDMYNAVTGLLGDGYESRARPKIIVFPSGWDR